MLPTCFYKRRNKTKQNENKKKKKVSLGRSQTRDLQQVRATHYPLHHETIATTICQINIFVPKR